MVSSFIPGISGSSSVPELIQVLRSSLKEEEFDEVERLLKIREAREKKLASKVKSLREENERNKMLMESLKGEVQSLPEEGAQDKMLLESLKGEVHSLREEGALDKKLLKSLKGEAQDLREELGQWKRTAKMVHGEVYEELHSVYAELQKEREKSETMKESIYEELVSQLTILEEVSDEECAAVDPEGSGSDMDISG